MGRSFVALLAAMLIVGIPVASVVYGQSNERTRSISVRGDGVIRVVPDMVTVRFGVVTRADDPESARRQNDEAAAAAMNAVRNLGVEERRIRLEVIQLNEIREYNPETRRPESRGYEAMRQVSVELEDLERLPELITYVVQSGANQLLGMAYDVRDRDSVRNEALRQAVLNARQKAALMAQTVDATLGQILSISEQSFDFPRPVMQFDQVAMASREMAAPEPDAYAAGEIEVRAVVSLTYEIQ